jgi:hypothetical protein
LTEGVLKANGNRFTKEQLEGMNMQVLEGIASVAGVGQDTPVPSFNYGGVALPRTPTNQANAEETAVPRVNENYLMDPDPRFQHEQSRAIAAETRRH